MTRKAIEFEQFLDTRQNTEMELTGKNDRYLSKGVK